MAEYEAFAFLNTEKHGASVGHNAKTYFVDRVEEVAPTWADLFLRTGNGDDTSSSLPKTTSTTTTTTPLAATPPAPSPPPRLIHSSEKSFWRTGDRVLFHLYEDRRRRLFIVVSRDAAAPPPTDASQPPTGEYRPLFIRLDLVYTLLENKAQSSSSAPRAPLELLLKRTITDDDTLVSEAVQFLLARLAPAGKEPLPLPPWLGGEGLRGEDGQPHVERQVAFTALHGDPCPPDYPALECPGPLVGGGGGGGNGGALLSSTATVVGGITEKSEGGETGTVGGAEKEAAVGEGDEAADAPADSADAAEAVALVASAKKAFDLFFQRAHGEEDGEGGDEGSAKVDALLFIAQLADISSWSGPCVAPPSTAEPPNVVGEETKEGEAGGGAVGADGGTGDGRAVTTAAAGSGVAAVRAKGKAGTGKGAVQGVGKGNGTGPGKKAGKGAGKGKGGAVVAAVAGKGGKKTTAKKKS